MLKVMIAENDLLMADMLEEILIDAGYDVCGIARTVAEGISLGKTCRPDLALLDLRLTGSELGTEIAAQLDRHATPGKDGHGAMGVLYATGNAGQLTLTSRDGDAVIDKPYRPADIIRALQIVTELTHGKPTSKPFPKGFHLLPPADGKIAKSVSAASSLLEEGIARLLRQQAALAAFGSFALGETDLEKILTEAARVCAESLDVPFCKVCRYRAEENDLLIEAGVGWHKGVVGTVVSRADRSSPQGRAFITGQPIICGNLSGDTGFILPSFYAEHGIASTLDVVIRKKSDGPPWGVLEIDNPKPHTYDQHDVNFLTGFANVLAEAVDSAKRNTVVQAALNQMKDMVADRDRLLAAQSRLLSEKVVLAQELQHRVRNNLQLVFGMLNKQIQSSDEGVGADALSAIARRVMTLAKVYDHLLGAGLSRTIDFGAYLSSLCDSFRDMENPQHGQITLTCASQPLMLDLDTATALGLVVAELISNSYLHAFPNNIGAIIITLAADPVTAQASIDFVDNGTGFTDHGHSKRRGIGLVRRLMQQVEGTAEVHSEAGTAWKLRFPLPDLTST